MGNSFTSRGCSLKFYFSEKIIGQLVENNTLTAWLSLLLPSYDFNSYSIGHRGKIIVSSTVNLSCPLAVLWLLTAGEINQLGSLKTCFLDTSTSLRPQEACPWLVYKQWLHFQKLCNWLFILSLLLSLFHNKEI